MKKMRQFRGAIFFASALLGCAGKNEENGDEFTWAPDDFIGAVEMKEDGTFVFQLRVESEDGIIGESMFEVKKEDKEYASFLEHVSPINPSESKHVKAWKE